MTNYIPTPPTTEQLAGRTMDNSDTPINGSPITSGINVYGDEAQVHAFHAWLTEHADAPVAAAIPVPNKYVNPQREPHMSAADFGALIDERNQWFTHNWGPDETEMDILSWTEPDNSEHDPGDSGMTVIAETRWLPPLLTLAAISLMFPALTFCNLYDWYETNDDGNIIEYEYEVSNGHVDADRDMTD